MASPSPFNTGRNYGPGIGYRGSNTGGQSSQGGYPRPYFPRQSQNQAQPRSQQEPESTDPEIQRAKNVAKAKRSGAFDVVRQRYNKAAAREGKQMDEEGNIVGLDSTPTQTLYAKTPTGRYKPAAKVPLTEADQPHEPTQEELDAQRQSAIKGKYAKGQSISDDARLEAGLPDTPRLSSADIAAAKARREQAEVIAAQEAEQAAAREAALTTSKEKKAAEVNTHKAYANSLKTKLMLSQKALAPLEAAEKAAQTNLALPKPDKAALLAARANHDAILKKVDEADTKVLEASLAYQKHLDAAADEGAKIDVFKAGIKTRKAQTINGVTVNTPEAVRGTSYDTSTGRIVGGASTEAKPDPQQPNIFRNTVEDENSPQNIDKNSIGNLLDINDPAKIKASKLMQQRMQLAQSEEDPNVRHYAQKDVEARMADPVKWEAAQYATMQEISDEDLAGKLQLMPQVIAQGQALLQQSQADAQAEQELYQQRLEIIAASNAKDKDKPFSMADTKVNTATGERWHTAHLNNYEATIKQANEAQAKALELLKTDENELNRDVAIHNARIIEAKRREDSKKAAQDKKREGVLRGLEAEGKHGLAGDLALINAEQKEKADQINPFIERGSDEHRAAQAVIEEETQSRIDKAVKEAAALPAKASELYKSWGRDANNNYTNWITNESPYDQGRSKDDSASTTEGYVKDAQRRKDLLEIQASKLGVNAKDLAYQLETQRILDWSKPLTEKADIQQNSLGNETAKKFGYIGEVEPTRTLPNGDVTVNPALGADQAEFDAAIKSAPASKEGKEAARKMWPAYHEAWLEKARETLSGADTVPGVEGYNDWVHRNIEAGWLTKPDGSLMSQNEQTQKYVDAMKGRGNFRKLLDNVGSSLLAGSHDIMTAIYGTGAVLTGAGEKLFTGDAGQISELFSAVGAEKSAQSERLMQAKGMEGTDTMFGSKLLGGAISQTARILPGMALTMATGSMGGAMLAGAMQTGGMQYADTYRTLIDQGYDHAEAWAKAAPAATYSGVMTAILTKAFPGGITALNNKANQAVLRQSVGDALKSYASGSARAMHAIARGALDEIPQETMDEFNSQMSQAMVEGKSPKQAVASFIANLPELIISTGIAGGLGGLGDMGGKAEAQPGANTPTGIAPQDLAAINTAIKGYTGGADATPEETTRTRNLAAALVKIKAGTKLAGLTQTELAAVGYERKADKIVPIKDAPQAAYEQDGNVIVTDAAIQEVTDAIPATNILGLKPESERLDEINNPPKAEASKATPESEPSNTDMSKEQAEAPKTGSEEWLQAMPESELDTKIASAANVVNKAATMATQDGGDEGFRNIAELAQNNLNRLRGEKARRQAAPPVSSDPHAQLKTNGGDVVHVADHAAAEKLAGRPVQKGRRAFTQRINGKPTVVVIDSEVASQKQRGGEAEMMAEETAHAQTMLDEDANPALADEADAAMADTHPDFDANLDAFMRSNYNGYHKLSNRQKRYEAVAKIVSGEYKGQVQSKGIVALLKDMLSKLLKRDPGGKNAAVQKIASNVRAALGTASVDAAAHEAATSPLNDKPQPTEAQKQAGNYPMGKLNISGLSISIENPSGSTRDWKNEAGESGTSKINGHYGYIKGTVGHDGDHIDALVKEGTPTDWDGTVYVVKQLKADGKTFDEDKVYIGFASEAEAKAAYRSNYQKGWRGYGGAIPVMMKDLAGLVKSGKLRKSPSTKSNARPTQQPAAVSTEPSLRPEGDKNTGATTENIGANSAGETTPSKGSNEHNPASAAAPIEAQLNAYIGTLKSTKAKAEAIYLRNKLLAVLKPYLATGLWTRVIVNATVPRSAEAANAGIGMGVLLSDKQTLTIHPQLLLDYAHQALQAEGRAKADEMIERGPFHELAHTLDPNSDQEASDLWNLVDEKTQRAFAESYFQGVEDKAQREFRADSWVGNKAMHAYAGREYFRAQLEKALLGSISEEVVANKALAKKLYAMIQALAKAINDFASTLKDRKMAGEITAKMNAAAARFLSKLPPEVQADIRAKASREGRTLPVAQSLPAAPRPAVGKAPPSQRIAIGKGMGGDSSFAEFASERDALAYRWYSLMKAVVSPGKNQDPKAASARAASALATVGTSLKMMPAELRALLTAYNKAVREQAKVVAEGEAFHAPRLEDFMRGGETQQMAAPAAMEARKQIQSDFDEAKREAEEDGDNFDEQRFIYDLRDGDLEAAYPDIYSDFFGNPETTNQIVYHHTPDENTESIIENGVGAMSKTRGLNNRGVRAAVFTSAEPDPMNSYGDTVVAIDLGAARKLSGVSTSLEPSIAESIRRAAVSNMLGIEDANFEPDSGSGETPDTLIIHGSVPKQAIQVSNKDGEVLFTGSAFGKSQAMAAPSYRSPTDMLAATKAQMQGGSGAKPAGLASMFNPQARRPATGERTLFEMPKQSVENIHAAYDSAVVGKSSAYITLDELYDALKAKEPAITERQMGDMLRKMDENGEASLEISEDSATTARNLAKYGLRMGTVPASGVAIHPRVQMMAAPKALPPMPQREAFYSKLAQVIESKMPVRADAKAVRGMIGNQSSGVKAEEIKWSGINTFLDSQSGLIAKADVLAYLNGEGAVRFVEHRLGGPTADEQKSSAFLQAEKASEAFFGKVRSIYGKVSVNGESLFDDELAYGLIDGNIKVSDLPDDLQNEAGLWLNAESKKNNFQPEASLPSKYSQYQLPGGENYREVVLAMPVKADKADPSKWTATQKDGKVLPWQTDKEAGALKTWEIRDENGKYVRSLPVSKFPTVEQAMAESERMYNTELETNLRGTSYTSSHFTDVPNYVAHARLNDRTDSEGQPGTFIEEIQSDRHQAGRDRGYADPQEDAAKLKELAPKIAAARAVFEQDEIAHTASIADTHDATKKAVAHVLSKYGASSYKDILTNSEAKKEYMAAKSSDKDVFAAQNAEHSALFKSQQSASVLNELIAQENAIKNPSQYTSKIPDAPYRTSWPLQMFKRALAEAVSTSKSWIGWTQGSTQAERFDLSKQVDRIEVRKSGDKYVLNAYDIHGNDAVQDASYTADQLPDVIGKDLAKKIVEDFDDTKFNEAVAKVQEKRKEFRAAANGSPEGDALYEEYKALQKEMEKHGVPEDKTYEGEDLKVGGEGMKGFYDSILPSAINDYIKQWKNEDGSKPKAEKKELAIQPDHQWNIVDDNGGLITSFPTKEGAEKWAAGRSGRNVVRNNKAFAPIWRVDITPAMAAGVEAGQALFMAAPAKQQQANIDAATYDFARPAPPEDPGHIRNASYIPKRGLQSNPQLPLTLAFYATNSLRAKAGKIIRSFENDWAPFFDFINDQLPAEKRKAGLRKIVNKFAMGDSPEAKALWKAYAAMPINEVLPADSERVKEAKELLPYLEQIEVMHMGAPKSQVTPEQDAEYLAAVESGDVAKQQAMVDAAAKAAGYTVGPMWHHGGFNATEDAVPQVVEEGMHFGTEDAARQRAYGKLVDDFIKEGEVTFDDDLGAWFWSSQGVDSYDVAGEEGFQNKGDAQDSLEQFASHEGEESGADASELGTFTKAYLKAGSAVKVADQKDSWHKAVAKAKAAGADAIEYKNLYEDKNSTSYIVFDPNQIKSADPITRDAEGNVIPLSQRFKDQSNDIRYMGAPKDQSGLDSRVLKRLANAMPEDDYLDQLDTAHSESFHDGSEGDWLRALQKENTTPDTVKAWDKAARKMIAADPQAVIDEIVNNFYEGKSFGSPELALAGSILSADVLKQAQLSGDEAMLRKARAFSYAVGAGETQAGRELRALNNPHKSNRERVAEVIANLFTTPPPAIRAKIANAPSPSAKLKKIAELQKRIKELEAQIVAGNKAAQKQADVAKKELEATLRTQDKAQLVDEALAKREKKVKEALANEGLTVEDVLLTPEDRLAAQDSEIVHRARAKHTAAQQKALLWIGRGFSDTDVAKFSGMERGAVATLREDYRNNSLKPEIAKEIKGGRSILEVIKDSFKKAFGINMAAPLPWSNVQRVQPTPPKPPKNKTVQPPKVEDTAADEIDRMLDILAPNARMANGNSLLAAVVKGKNGTRVTIQVPFDADDFKSVYRVARAISISEASGFDKMYEYWINNLLSGPQTNFVNIIGNTLSVGIQYLAQRPLETAVNLFTRDDQSAQLGEWEYIAKGVATGLGEAWQNAVLAFSVEADPTAHRYLNEPMQIGFTPSGDVAKMGGYRGPSVKGARGRVIRIPGRLLRMMDAMFKTFILHAEVGAMAYRLGKIEQSAGRIGATGADLQAFIQDQIATKGSKSWMQAMRTATDLTFQDENWLTDIAKNFTQGADKFVDKRRADAAKAYAEDDTELGHSMELRANAMYFTAKLMSIIFPFVRTPSNILRMGVRKSPLGSLLLPLHFIQMIRQGVTNKIKGKDFLDSYPKGVLVKLLAEQTLAWMVTMGLMSAIEGDDDDDKKRFIIIGGRPWKDSGATDAARRDYGGTYLLIWRNDKGEETRIPFGRYEPVATLLGTTADAVRRLKERARRERNGEPGANMEDAVKALMGDFVNQAGDKSFLQGIAGVMKEIESLENSGDLSKGIKETAWKATLSAIVPNLIRQVMRNTDDKVRDSKKKGDWYDAFPMGSNAEPVIDLFGHDVEKGGDPFTRILFPVANKQLPTHPITPLIHQWNSKNTADKIEPTPMNRSGFYIYNTDGKTKIPLVTPQEKAALQRVIGSNLITSAATVAENIKANGGELPENFDKVVDKIITAARTDARKTAIQSSPFLAAKQKQP